MSTDLCPRCGGQLEYDEVDVGIGTMRGNPGCPDCHWTPGGDPPAPDDDPPDPDPPTPDEDDPPMTGEEFVTGLEPVSEDELKQVGRGAFGIKYGDER